MIYTDQEIEALAQWAISSDPVNWELFNSQPKEARLRALDWWWANIEDMEFKAQKRWQTTVYHNGITAIICPCIKSTYILSSCMLNLEISLSSAGVASFSIKVNNSNIIDCQSIQNTDDLPLDQIRTDIYNTIKKHLSL
jgi:hypothetical protein